VRRGNAIDSAPLMSSTEPPSGKRATARRITSISFCETCLGMVSSLWRNTVYRATKGHLCGAILLSRHFKWRASAILSSHKGETLRMGAIPQQHGAVYHARGLCSPAGHTHLSRRVRPLGHPPEWCSALAPRALGVPRVWSSRGRCRLVISVTILPPRPFEVRCKKAGCCVGGLGFPAEQTAAACASYHARWNTPRRHYRWAYMVPPKKWKGNSAIVTLCHTRIHGVNPVYCCARED
jgi:hypothetical protein